MERLQRVLLAALQAEVARKPDYKTSDVERVMHELELRVNGDATIVSPLLAGESTKTLIIALSAVRRYKTADPDELTALFLFVYALTCSLGMKLPANNGGWPMLWEPHEMGWKRCDILLPGGPTAHEQKAMHE